MIPYSKQLIDEDDIDAVAQVLRGDYLTQGPKVEEFEKQICTYTGAKYAVVVANGTAALHLSSLVLLKPGDKVLTTPNSFLATANALLYVGAKPVFVDICEDGNIDLDLCEEALKKDRDIKAIYAVHFSGNMIDQQKLSYLREKFGIAILEDCAHSIGAKDYDIKAGSSVNSDCSIFSFHPVKNITSGEGGAITTNSKTLYEKLIELRMHGINRKDFINTDMAYDKNGNLNPWYYEMHTLGFNYRITDFQSALGITQFQKLDQFIKKRQLLAKRYNEAFKNTQIKPLYEYSKKSSYHLFVVRADFTKSNITKAELFMKMSEKGIKLQLHYIPINKQPYYKNLGYANIKTPVMDRYYKECFSLPIYPNLSKNEQDFVIKSVLECLS